MTQEEKAKAYDNALERARNIHKDAIDMGDNIRAKQYEIIFPVLRESKDDRIMRVIRGWIYTRPASFFDNGISKEEILAWLEKQGKQEEPQVYDTGDGEVITYSETEGYKVVEPKFHEGEWVACKELNTAKIINNEGDRYEVELIDGNKGFPHIDYVDRYFHLWNIHDAKKGDVLALSYAFQNYILIYKGLHEKNFDTMMSVFCSYYVEENTYEDETDSFHAMNRGEIITPATKEQRDILIKAMADAGYTFDFEKKELKEIETEIEIPFGAKDSELQEATYYIPKGFYAEIDDDKVVIKKGEKHTAWSKKDEKMFEYALNMIEWYSGKNEDKSRFVSDWLKSIKQRIGG